MDLVITIGIIGAVLAGLACYLAHGPAKARRWPFVPRYVYGVGVALLAYAPVVFAATDRPTAVLLCALLGLIVAVEGVATGLAHLNTPDAPRSGAGAGTQPDADRILSKLDEELGHENANTARNRAGRGT
jgi:uncharacterized membrane protein HdeD (DUF308 family)